MVLRVHFVGAHEPRDDAVRTGSAHDVVVDLDEEHRVADLTAAIAEHLGLDPAWHLAAERTGRVLDAAVPVSRSSLVQGDGVVLCRSPADAPRPPHLPRSTVAVDVVGGPATGRTMRVNAGRYSMGRGGACDLVLHDPTVERHHASISVDPARGTVEVAPAGPAPVLVGGEPLDGPLVVGPHDTVEIGRTRLVFRPVRRNDTPRPEHRGQVQFQRTPYRPPVVSHREVGSLGPAPRRPEPRRFQVLSVLAPLAAGLVMYAFSRQVQFLALTLVSPIVMIGNAVDDRRSGRKAQRAAVVDFRDRVVEHRQTMVRALAAERTERWLAAPDAPLLARRACERSVDLWERGRSAPDFLRLRVGLGHAPAACRAVVEPGGDEGLRAEALDAMTGLDHVTSAPIVVDVGADGVVAVDGPPDLVDGVVASLIVQAVCLHGPDDLVLVAAMPAERRIAWSKWLPHTRSVTSPIAGRHLARTADHADRLVADLLAVAAFRREHDVTWPQVLVVVDPAVGADAPSLSHLLDVAPEVGMRVLWVSSRAADVPRQAVSVLTCDPGDGGRGVLWTTDADAADAVAVELEPIPLDVAERIARDLAPVRDTSTAAVAGSIPRTVALLDCVGHESTSPARLVDRWLTPAPFGLRFPIGTGAAGPVEIDLVHDGPHALVAGTSGAGKSELLQTMVASLATRYSPERLTFLFVDYKGGAASSTFAALPHTVGHVTNLGADLAWRALTSLRAELTHRMQLMEEKAKDLEEMTALFPHAAPPALVIVVDEFATLVNEIPEFVAGIVDIAQRGRSLGIHLVLATQRPSGAVNENILANTNLRISLRMLERGESTSVIGTPDAADIPVPLRGRAIVRLGGQHLVPVQCAYGGAPFVRGSVERPVLVGDFDEPGSMPVTAGTVASHPSRATTPVGQPADQLTAVVAAVAVAHERLGSRPPRRPWQEPLPDHVSLAALLDDHRTDPARRHPGRHVVIGTIDAPERQDQHPLVVDLEDGGGLLVFGSGGAGKTTVLRTIAAAIEATAEPGAVDVLAFDLTSRGLTGLRPLSCVVDVATVDDAEAITRHIVTLEGEIERRRAALGAGQAEHLTAYHERGGPLSRIVLLIDGYGGLADTLGDSATAGTFVVDSWAERLVRVIVDGRQVGVHAVITAARRSALPSRLHAAVAPRLVLRHAEPTAYAEHGVRAALGDRVERGNGRGLWRGDSVVQVACVSDDPGAKAQSDALAGIARRRPDGVHNPLATEALPDVLAGLPHLGRATALVAPLGLTDVTGEPAELDLRWSHAVVAGPPRSGRSTALASIGAALASDHEVHRLGPAGCGLSAMSPAGGGAFAEPGDAAALLDRIDNLCALGTPLRPVVFLVDDADRMEDEGLGRVWERLLTTDGVRVVAALETRALTGFTTDPLVSAMKRARRLLLLQPDDPAEFVQITGVKLPRRPGVSWPPGRGVLVADRVPRIVHVALPRAELSRAPGWAGRGVPMVV
jgi:S-DNA-T family DNA segregation ATPase FtsK/SpoIIIE